MLASLERYPALVLNADYRPLSYFPLSLWSWQDAVKAAFLDRVNIVSEYDRLVRSPSWAFRLPSVISLKRYISTTRRPARTPSSSSSRHTRIWCREKERRASVTGFRIA